MGIFKEILQNQVKKGLEVEGKNFIDPVDKLKIQGQDIEVTQEVQTVKDIASGNICLLYTSPSPRDAS